jgi:hypothetical protein
MLMLQMLKCFSLFILNDIKHFASIISLSSLKILASAFTISQINCPAKALVRTAHLHVLFFHYLDLIGHSIQLIFKYSMNILRFNFKRNLVNQVKKKFKMNNRKKYKNCNKENHWGLT